MPVFIQWVFTRFYSPIFVYFLHFSLLYWLSKHRYVCNGMWLQKYECHFRFFFSHAHSQSVFAVHPLHFTSSCQAVQQCATSNSKHAKSSWAREASPAAHWKTENIYTNSNSLLLKIRSAFPRPACPIYPSRNYFSLPKNPTNRE